MRQVRIAGAAIVHGNSRIMKTVRYAFSDRAAESAFGKIMCRFPSAADRAPVNTCAHACLPSRTVRYGALMTFRDSPRASKSRRIETKCMRYVHFGVYALFSCVSLRNWSRCQDPGVNDKARTLSRIRTRDDQNTTATMGNI